MPKFAHTNIQFPRKSHQTWTVFQSYQNAPASTTGHHIPSHADYSPAPLMRIAATTQVALATIVLAKLALALTPSYNGPWSLAFIAQVALFVGGTSTAFQAVAFSDAESVSPPLLVLFAACFITPFLSLSTGPWCLARHIQIRSSSRRDGRYVLIYISALVHFVTKKIILEIELTAKPIERPEDAFEYSFENFPMAGTLISHGLAAALSIGAFVLESHPCMGALLISFLGNEIQRAPLRNTTRSTRQVCWSSLKVFKVRKFRPWSRSVFMYLFCVLQKVAESIVCACLFYYLLSGSSLQLFGRSLQNIRLDASMSPDTAYILFLCIWCYLCFVGTSPLALVTLALKIDYCRHVRTAKQSGGKANLTESNEVNTAAMLDSLRLPILFPKPYYYSSIMSLLLSAVGSYAVLRLVPFVADLHTRVVFFAFVVLFTLNSIIFISLSAFLQAWQLDELSFVWVFEEDSDWACVRNSERQEENRDDEKSGGLSHLQDRPKVTASSKKLVVADTWQ